MNKQLAAHIANRVLYEQGSMGGALMPDFSTKMGITNKDRVAFWDKYHHEIMIAAEIGSLVIPLIGPAISTGIAAVDAAMYWKEGDRYTAGFIAVLTAIPVIGSLTAKIPGVKKLGAAGIRRLASKMAKIKSGAKPALSKAEWAVIKNLSKHQKEVYSTTKKYFAKAGKVSKKVGSTAATAAATYTVGKPTWDALYVKTGLDISDVETQTDPVWQQLKKQAQAQR